MESRKNRLLYKVNEIYIEIDVSESLLDKKTAKEVIRYINKKLGILIKNYLAKKYN